MSPVKVHVLTVSSLWSLLHCCDKQMELWQVHHTTMQRYHVQSEMLTHCATAALMPSVVIVINLECVHQQLLVNTSVTVAIFTQLCVGAHVCNVHDSCKIRC
jgi:hypothetical protein